MAMSCDRARDLASGFVLGALDPDEMSAVGDHLDTCSRPHPEFEDLGGVVSYLADSVEPIEPPGWLRDSVIAAAKADLTSRRRLGRASEGLVAQPLAIPVTASEAAAPEPRHGAAATVISFKAARRSRRRRALTWATRIAAAVAVVALAGYALVLQGDLDQAKKVQAQDNSLAMALGQPDTITVTLAAPHGSKASGVAALRPTGNIWVRVSGLTPTTGDEVYVVWLSTNGGSAAKVGSLTVDDSGLGRLSVDNVSTAASLWIFVCREPNGNVTTPTGPTIVSGSISI
jgi:hypothetical protein